MRRLVVGDIHGCYDKLLDVLSRANFNAEEDTLYSLGDLCDRGNRSKDVLDYLIELPNFVGVFGNHDIWLKSYIDDKLEKIRMLRAARDCWSYNGGIETIKSLASCSSSELEKYVNFINKFRYRIALDNAILMHNPINTSLIDNSDNVLDSATLENCQEKKLLVDSVYDDFLWNRSVPYLTENPLSTEAQEYKDNNEKLVICGHTPLEELKYTPQLNLLMIDTGSFIGVKYPAQAYGWPHEGRITALDIDTGEYWQSGVDSVFSVNLSSKQ